MSRLLKKWELENSPDNESYDDCMTGLLNICDMDDSYDGEIDRYENLNNNGDWSYKGLDYDNDLSEEDNYDENSMTNDEMSDLP